LRDRFVEQPFRGRHSHQRADLTAAPRLAEDGDVGRISAECSDVVADPFECLHDVEHPGIARIGVLLTGNLAQIQVSEQIEAMVQRDDDDVAMAREVCAVVDDEAARRLRIAAAMEPYHDRTPSGAERGRPDVQTQAIFAGGLTSVDCGNFRNQPRRSLVANAGQIPRSREPWSKAAAYGAP
jgi:hypothetical protein